MLKKNKTQTEHVRTVEQQSLSAIVMRTFSWGVAGLFVLALGAYVVLVWYERDDIVQQLEKAKTEFNRNAELILGHYIDRANLLATDPHLVDVIKSGEERQVRQQSLAKMANAAMVLLFARGEEKQLVGEFPLLSFSELDLVYEADKGGEPRLEYYKLNDGKAYLDIVRPLTQNSSITGYVLARFDSDSLIEALKKFIGPDVRVELSQVLSKGTTETFISLGEASVKNAAEAYTGGFQSADWQLSYWQQPHPWQVMSLDWRIFYWLVFIIVTVVLALIMFILSRILEKRVTASVNVLYGYVRDRTAGKWMGKDYLVELVEFQPVLNNLQNLNWADRLSNGKNTGVTETMVETTSGRSAAEASEQGRKAFEQSYVDILYQGGRGVEVDDESEDKNGGTVADKPARKLPRPKPKSHATSPVKSTESTAASAEKTTPETPNEKGVPRAIFRAYDIRGVVDNTLTGDVVYQIGLAFGTEAWQCGEQTVVVGRDGRLSSQALAKALIKGLRESGRDVIDVGQVPTPVVYFSTHYLNARSAVMVTGSHNPVNYNGLKLVLQGEALAEDRIQKIYRRIQSGDYSVGEGSYSEQNLLADYLARLQADVELGRSLKVVVDCGNGVAGTVLPGLLRSLGCEVVELYCEVDGHFPNHHPDPSQVANLQALIAAVKDNHADVGLALDGDGDRLGVVDSQGAIIWPDRQLMLYAVNILRKHSGGQVIYDVKSSRHLHHLIEKAGGRPLMWKSGHSLMKAKLKETGALLAGEMSGHVFFNDRWYGFDDGLYTAVRLLEILSNDERPSSAVFAELPDAVSTPELLAEVGEGEQFKLMQHLQDEIEFPDARLVTLDGIRAEFKHGWGLVRASNTTPCLMFRFEADDERALEQIKMLFRKQFETLAPALKLPF